MQQFDAIVVGAGFSGLYMAHLLRQSGFTVKGFERGDDVGGTWYWNRYPGCRCDVESMEYSYQFSDELEQEWSWPERYSGQPEILAYANHVADRLKLRELFEFKTSVVSANYDDGIWQVAADSGRTVRAQYLIMATGCLSAANIPDFEGINDFAGQTYHTGAWPSEGVDFTGQRVGIIGTGSSAIQSIPIIAQQARSLTVFQRTPNYSVPARNAPMDPEKESRIKSSYKEYRKLNFAQHSAFGAEYPRATDSALDLTDAERQARFEEYWQLGGFMFLGAFSDIGTNKEANWFAAEFVRSKIREIVKDERTAELLCPTNMIGCKRLCADTGYFETYNRDNVHLVDVSSKPIEKLTQKGLQAGDQEFELDTIIFATGFDAMTGALLRCSITGEKNLKLKDKWAEGPRTYLGLAMAGFPNLFTMTGPGSPSVLANMITGAEQHAEFIANFLVWLRTNGHSVAQASKVDEDAWVDVVNQRSSATLYPSCNSWYLGANVPGKPRVFMPYIGFPDYTAQLERVVAAGYEGFVCA